MGLTPYYQEPGITIYCGDCRKVLPTITADVLITDPPFNVGKPYGVYDDRLSLTAYEAMMQGIAQAGPCLQAWITPTNRLRLFSQLLGDEAYPVVIRRGAKGPKRWGWFDQFDLILVRGRPLRYTSNLWEDIRLKGEGYFFRETTYGHPGYTPYEIMLRLIDLLATPDDLVVDPFCGTGTLLRAAKDVGRCGLGIEIDERWCEVAVERLRQGVLPLGAD